MKVILYEHICGGEYSEQSLPPSVLAEGYAMLRCAVEDFKLAGHEVTVLLDSRISILNPPLNADFTVPIACSDETIKFLSAVARINDAIYIIAPETNLTLQALVKSAEQTKKVVLNSASEAIAAVADKASLYTLLQENGVPTPKTLIFNLDNSQDIGRVVKDELGYPTVFKPITGAGCNGITLLKSEAQISSAIEKIKSESKDTRFIAQKYLSGENLSVSLIADGKKACPLTLNSQQINLSDLDESSYCGGVVPFENSLKREAFALAQRVVESVGGLRGYVGVDMILADGGLFVADVNARLTTSYVGLRRVAKLNIAQAIVDAVVEGKLPAECQTAGVACFQKIPKPKPTKDAYRKVLEIDGVISPPFPLEGNISANALLLGYGENLASAQRQLSRANKSLLDNMC